MKQSNLVWSSLVLAAMSACPVLGQQRVGGDGRALDASNRVGSGGLNDGGGVNNNTGSATGNQIVTGNVTGNRQFRGNVGYGDPRDFRGTSSSDASDRFLRSSTGVDYRQNYSAPSAYYGGRTVTPPPGFQQQPGTGAYIPTPTATPQPGDQRLGDLGMGQVYTPIQPGQLLMSGPVDAQTNQPTMITASPLYGVRQWNMSDTADRNFLSQYSNLRMPSTSDKLGLTDAQLAKARMELADTVVEGEAGPKPDKNVMPPGNFKTQNLDTPVTGVTMASDTTTNQGTQLRLQEPGRQSAQFAEMRKRMEKNAGDRKLNDEELNRIYMAQVTARLQAESDKKLDPRRMPPSNAGGNDPFGVDEMTKKNQDILSGKGIKPGTSNGSAPLPEMGGKPYIKPEPLKISSLADGIKAEGLKGKMLEAETLMKQGKFASALDSYDSAEKIAPNNPMVLLGRAHAEMGASYYGRAEADLRSAIGSAPELLVGQYDLRAFLGEERLTSVIKDLKDIADSETKQVRPVFLLAYLSYNTGNERRAAAYLDMTEQRGGPDQIVRRMRESWNLPGDDK